MLRRFAIAVGLALVPATAGATWSIVAVDPATGQVGAANASCVEAPYGTTILPLAVGVVPDVGALAAQAAFDGSLRAEAMQMLADGVAADDLVAMITAIDGGAAYRQWGVVTLDLQTAAFTGAANDEWAGHLEGVGVTVQGNILYGAEVVGDALAAFEAEPPACPWTLADRLMLALEAGAAQGGDNRCSERQSALATTLQVAYAGDDPGAPTIDLRIGSQPHGGDNPVVLLRAVYDDWRAANPPDDSACGDGTTGGDDGTTGANEHGSSSGAGESSSSGARPPADDAALDDGGDDSAGAPDTTGADTTGASAAAESTGTRGCGCGHRSDSLAALAAILALAGLRRRSSASAR